VITSGILELCGYIPENVEYFSCLDNMITNGAGCAGEFKSRISKAQAALNKK
jgi:hypothetical protein